MGISVHLTDCTSRPCGRKWTPRQSRRRTTGRNEINLQLAAAVIRFHHSRSEVHDVGRSARRSQAIELGCAPSCARSCGRQMWTSLEEESKDSKQSRHRRATNDSESFRLNFRAPALLALNHLSKHSIPDGQAANWTPRTATWVCLSRGSRGDLASACSVQQIRIATRCVPVSRPGSLDAPFDSSPPEGTQGS